MFKPSILALAAILVAGPATAQMAADPAAPPAAAAALPMCSAKVKDSCQQGPRQEAAAMTAAQAEASGGVGDRNHDQSAMTGGKMAPHKMTHHRKAHRKAMKKAAAAPAAPADAAPADAAAMPPK